MKLTEEGKLKIRINPIKNGTVIDHLKPGLGIKLIEILGHSKEQALSAAFNTETQKVEGGRKDLIMFENRFLTKKELDKIKLIAQNATHNEIKDFKVVKKERLDLPSFVEGIIECINPNCITNHEAIETKFFIFKNPIQAKCFYCETIMEENQIRKAIK